MVGDGILAIILNNIFQPLGINQPVQWYNKSKIHKNLKVIYQNQQWEYTLLGPDHVVKNKIRNRTLAHKNLTGTEFE